jgi:Tfp pilus assembly protein PilW
MMIRSPERDESGVSLIEVMLASMLFALVVVSVDTSINVVQTHQVQISDQTQALDNLQVAQQAISRDVHAAVAWTTPTLPTTAPSSPITAQTLAFTAQLGSGTPTINIALSTATHILTVRCTGVGCTPASTSTSVITQAQVSNIDPATLFTMTTSEVSNTVNSTTTNDFYFTDVATSLILVTPKVGAPHAFKITLADPDIVANNVEYVCENDLGNTGSTGTC